MRSLREIIDSAVAEVATWPKWKRDMYEAFWNQPSDPRWTCRHRRVCDWHQSCNGKPCESGPARHGPEAHP